MLLVIWLVVLTAALVLWLRRSYSRFSRYGVKNLPVVPVLGNMIKTTLRMQHFVETLDLTYKSYPKDRFVGFYQFTTASVFIRDLELIKKITIKDFENFLNHRIIIDKEADPYFAKNLFSMEGQAWKEMRSMLSPAFTSSKIRHMVPLMAEVGEQMIIALKNKIKTSDNDYLDVDSKDLLSRYTNDVIASCAFGLKVDSHTEENNTFYKTGKEISNFGFRATLVFFGYLAVPKLMKLLKIKLISDNQASFFKELVLGTMQRRDIHNIVRPDMIQLLMDAKKGRLTHDEISKETDTGFATVEEVFVEERKTREWTDEELIAQAVIFFIAGFESVSNAMIFALYELALNPDVQDKLVEEIKTHHKKNGEKFDFTSIQHMKYMDMVVSEVLRLWPPGIATDRVCQMDYNLGKPNEKATQDYIIRKGEGVGIPIWSIHRDPEHFPNPEKFDPERFSDENKHNIKPFSYMPFGVGPRNCIASRFALCELKAMVYQLLLHMEVSPSERTVIPPRLSTESFNLRLKGGHSLRLRVRP